jgi:hypothetical protein
VSIADAGGRSGVYRRWTLAFLLAGCVLRVIQYGANSAQWLDEIILSTSVVSRSTWQLLTTRLDSGQSAPPGVLAIEKLSVVVFGPNDLAFRAYSFLCSLVALVLFHRIVEMTLRGISRPIAVALFATAVPLITFSAQAKQYSSDVVVALLLSWLALGIQMFGLTRRRLAVATLTGVVSAWFSQAALFILAGVSLALLWDAWTKRPKVGIRSMLPLLTMVAAWGVSALVVLVLEHRLVSQEQHEFLYRFWAHAFMPTRSVLAAGGWLLRSMRGIFFGRGSASLLYPMPWVFVALGTLGAWSLWRRQRAGAAVFAGPFLLTLGAAIAHLYPFADRLILFLIPTALLSVSEGIGAIVEVAVGRVGRPGILAAAIALPGLFPVADPPPPYVAENIKPVLGALRDRRKVGDSIYVYYGAEAAMQFYGKQYDLRPSDYQVGACHRGQPREYLRELDAYRGKSRVWVVVSHAIALYGERQAILAYLDTIGVRRETLVAKSRGARGAIPDTADLYLFDLGDPQRSSNASSATFPLEVVPLDERFGCI